MATRDWRSDYSNSFYSTLLLLYPARFRTRFAAEMIQVFRDCFRDEAADGGLSTLLVFWLRIFRDLARSVFEERRRELLRFVGVESALVALAVADSLLVPMMICTNLVGLGQVVTLLIQGVPPDRMPPGEFMMVSAAVTFGLGMLGVLRALIVARIRPLRWNWIKL